MRFKFKEDFTFEKRQTESRKIHEKFPDRIACIIECSRRSDLPALNKVKYLVPKDLTVSQFIHVIRKHIKIDRAEAIFLFMADGVMCTGCVTIEQAYELHHDEDGFLYIQYSKETTFG